MKERLPSRGDMMRAQRGQCAYCRCPIDYRMNLPLIEIGRAVTIDHVVPLSRGGENVASNRVAACYTCNQMKNNLSADEFIAILRPNR